MDYHEIPGFSRYWVTEDGRVRSKDRGWLKPRAHKDGYLMVRLVADEGGRKNVYIHRLVLLALRGEPLDGAVSRHLDGNPLNNTVENLRWGTQRQNMRDRDRHGTVAKGRRNGRAKLTANEVRAIRFLRDFGFSFAELARRYGIDKTSVRDICNRVNWRHVA